MRKNIKKIVIFIAFVSIAAIGYYSGIINVLAQNVIFSTVKGHIDASEIHINDKLSTPEATPQETPTTSLPVVEAESKPEVTESSDLAEVAQVSTNSETDSNNVILGDSLTEGLSVFGFFPEAHIIGVNSLNTISALEQVDNVASYKPTKLFILLGINDLWEGGYDSCIDDYINQYTNLITEIKKKTGDCSIYIESILPISQYAMERNSCISNDIINEANSRIYKMTQELSVKYIDVNTGLKNEQGNLPGEYTSDGVHFIKDYYPLWADQLTSYMK